MADAQSRPKKTDVQRDAEWAAATADTARHDAEFDEKHGDGNNGKH